MPADDAAFLTQAEDTMKSIVSALDAFDPDELEADLAGGVLRITFAGGRTCIMNRQSAAHQIWLAEGAMAWHFERDAGTGLWMDTKGRGELRRVLAEVLSKRLGRPVGL